MIGSILPDGELDDAVLVDFGRTERWTEREMEGRVIGDDTDAAKRCAHLALLIAFGYREAWTPLGRCEIEEALQVGVDWAVGRLVVAP